MIDLFVLYGAFVAVFALATLAVNLGWSRLLGTHAGYGFWAASLITIPALSVLYGIYSHSSYAGCPSDGQFGYYCESREENLLSVGFLNFLLIPLFSLCVSIPVTMWFVKRSSKK
ncbi:MAG: hypothetical protein AAF697_02120 [Pseudomonadota bacterium]